MRVLLVLASAVFLVGLIVRTPCASGAWWDSPRDYANACHSELITDYTAAGLAAGVPAWDASPDRHLVADDRTAPDALLSYGAARVAQQLLDADIASRSHSSASDSADEQAVRQEAVVFFGISAAVQLLCFLSGVLLLVRSSREPYRLAVLAGAPVVAFMAMLGWDMVTFAVVCAAWWAWRTQRRALAGGLIGVAGVLAFWPIWILVAITLTSLRDRAGELAARAFGGAVIGAVCTAVPLVLISHGAYFDPVGAYASAAGGSGSIWELLSTLGYALGSTPSNLAVVIAMTVVLVGVTVFALKAAYPPNPETVALLLVLGWLLVTKTYQPQYALALLPLAALAWPRWRDLLVWQSGEVLFLLAMWWHLGGFTMDSGNTDRVYPVLIAVRMAAQLWLGCRVVLAHRRGSSVSVGSVEPAPRGAAVG